MGKQIDGTQDDEKEANRKSGDGRQDDERGDYGNNMMGPKMALGDKLVGAKMTKKGIMGNEKADTRRGETR